MKNPKEKYTWTLIASPQQLAQFYRENRQIQWLAFDTEFIPERYFKSKLCVISIATDVGNYIIDVLSLPDLSPFIQLLEDHRIQKITHAGENDYQILQSEYHVKLRNIFDTQLAYGFLDFEYPLGLQVLLHKELELHIPKMELCSDWEKRPLTLEQMAYAVSDVIYLHPLKQKIEARLKDANKLDWAYDECRRWEESDYFKFNAFDYYSQLPLQNLNKKQKIFMIRLHQWRIKEAKAIDCPVSGILKTRFIKNIARHIGDGKAALMNDRTMPHKVLKHNWGHFRTMFRMEASLKELEFLHQLPEEENVDPETQVTNDMLYHLIKLKAASGNVSPNLILSKKELQKMKLDGRYFPSWLGQGWRREFLGEELLNWLKLRNAVHHEIAGYTCILTMKDKSAP